MICDPCKDKNHDKCLDSKVGLKSWCDCQHREGITTEKESLAAA